MDKTNDLIEKVVPIARRIYEECKEEKLTTEEFNAFTFLLEQASLWLRTEDDKKKLNETLL